MDIDKIKSTPPQEIQSTEPPPSKTGPEIKEESAAPQPEKPIEDKVEIISEEQIIKLSPEEREKKLNEIIEKVKKLKIEGASKISLVPLIPFIPFIPLIPLLPKSKFKELLILAKNILKEPPSPENPDTPSSEKLSDI